jgi:hypothetical protein
LQAVMGMSAQEGDRRVSKWMIHRERVVDDSRKMKVSIASVELPDGVEFEQYIFGAPRVAMTAGSTPGTKY